MKSAIESMDRFLVMIKYDALDLTLLLFLHLMFSHHNSVEIMPHHLKTTVIFHLTIK